MDEEVFSWLCSNNQINDSDKIIVKDTVEKLIDNVRIFDDADNFIDDLSNVIDEKIFVWLGSNHSYLANILKDFDQILYIYLSEPVDYKGTNKIRGVFSDCTQLLCQLKKDIQIWKNSQVYLTFSEGDSRRMETTTTEDIRNHQASFMWSQMLLETLLRIPTPSQNPHEDLLVEARRLYANNQSSLKVIDEFEKNYDKNEAIKWYTRDCFVYRLVNKALRTRDICLIFKFRFLIQDIYQQLKIEQMKTLASIQLPMTVYRGQFMTNDEFDRIQRNTKQLISVNTFLSTSRHRQVACMLSGEGLLVDLDIISIVFEICIDSTVDLALMPPFADIHQLSYMPDEGEILLSMGTVLEVISVEKIDSKNATISLRLCHNDHADVKQMKTYLLDEISRLGTNETAYIDHLGLMLSFMGENKKAEQMWNLIASYKDPVDNPVRQFSVYSARMAQQFFESETTRPIYENEQRELHALMNDAFRHPTVPDTFRNTIQPVCNHFIYPSQNSTLSNENLQSNMNVFHAFANALVPSTHPSMADSYIMQAEIHRKQNRYVEALEYFEKAFDICEKSLDITHPYHTYILANMASIYMKLDDDIHAEQIIQRFQIHQTTSPIIAIYALRISTNFFTKQKDWQAVIVCQQEIIQRSEKTPNSQDIILAYMVIGDTYYQMKEFDNALDYLHMAQNLQLKHYAADNFMACKIEEVIAKINHAKRSSQ